MEISAHQPSAHTADKAARNDPKGFVVAIVMALFAVTALAVMTMQLANDYNWQIF